MGRQDTFEIYDKALGHTLAERLRAGRKAGKPFTDIAYDLRAEGVNVSYETVRQWCIQIGAHEPRPTEPAA